MISKQSTTDPNLSLEFNLTNSNPILLKISIKV